MVTKIDSQALATILAALRYYQENEQGTVWRRSDAIHAIATNDGDIISLDYEGIDDLCELLNTEHPISKAKARLIAAAPDMLRMLHIVEHDVDWTNAGQTLGELRATIAKAKGETA